MSEKWLMEKIPGYAALPGPDRDAITTFALLWSLFERKLMGSEASARKIASAVDQWNAAGGIAAELYNGEVAYFRDRYFQNGEFTFRFDKLQLRKWDMPDLIAAGIIPSRGDHDPCAHWRVPMDLMRSGWSISLFQASQQ